jgi:hypothetical protein
MRTMLIGLALLGLAGACHAQRPGEGAPLPTMASTDPDMRNKHQDPAAVEIPLYAGARVLDVLQALKDKGFLIKWDKDEITPDMTLREKPKAGRVDKLLTEILEPWGMRADRNQFDGGFRVRPMKKSKK